MARPQQPELARSAKTDLDPDHVETGLQGQKKPSTGGETGPIPADNQPGHHPAKEQDKPDLDALAARLGADPKAPAATGARKPGRSKTAPAKATPPKATPTRPTSAKGASRPATGGGQKTPAAPPKIEATPARRPAAAPTSGPKSAPNREDAAHVSVPQPEPEGPGESPIVGLVLLPLRETVKWLDQVERRLTQRLTGSRG